MMPRDLRNSSAAAAPRPLSAGKCTRRKFATLGVTVSPSRPSSLPSQGSQVSLWRAAASTWAASSMAAMPAAIAGEETLNGPRTRFSTSAIAAGQ
jgi:hypothetical protein